MRGLTRARADADIYLEAATAMDALEAEQHHLDEVNASNVTLEAVIGRAILSGGYKLNDLIGRWDEKRRGLISRSELGRRLGEMDVLAEGADLERLYDDILQAQAQAERSATAEQADLKRCVMRLFEFAGARMHGLGDSSYILRHRSVDDACVAGLPCDAHV